MVIKVYISGISASKEVKKRQQRAQMILDSLRVKYEAVDITEPGHEAERELMKNVCKKRNNNTIALPPQFFNEDQYCGDYEDFETASDDDTVLSFLKLEEDITIENGDLTPTEGNDNIDDNVDNDNIADEPIINGDNSSVNNDQNNIDEELVEEVVTVQETLKVGGKVVEIPEDRQIEVGGKKIDLNEMLVNKNKKIDDDTEVSHNVEVDQTVTQNNQMEVDLNNEEEDKEDEDEGEDEGEDEDEDEEEEEEEEEDDDE